MVSDLRQVRAGAAAALPDTNETALQPGATDVEGATRTATARTRPSWSEMSNYEEYEREELRRLVEEEGSNWMQRHCIQPAQFGEYKCTLCGKELKALCQVWAHPRAATTGNRTGFTCDAGLRLGLLFQPDWPERSAACGALRIPESGG